MGWIVLFGVGEYFLASASHLPMPPVFAVIGAFTGALVWVIRHMVSAGKYPGSPWGIGLLY